MKTDGSITIRLRSDFGDLILHGLSPLTLSVAAAFIDACTSQALTPIIETKRTKHYHSNKMVERLLLSK